MVRHYLQVGWDSELGCCLLHGVPQHAVEVLGMAIILENYLGNVFFALYCLLTSKSQDNLTKHSGTVLNGINCDTKFFKLLMRYLFPVGLLRGQREVLEDFCMKVKWCI